MPVLAEKLTAVRTQVKSYGSALVAFSGGVDSALLLAIAREQLAEQVMAAIFIHPLMPQQEAEAGCAYLKKNKIRHVVLRSERLVPASITHNPPDRCYLCKRHWFGQLRRAARLKKFTVILDGTQADDLGTHRPGRKALSEFGIQSPLADAFLAKAEIRRLAREVYFLPMADKPSGPCLATRFPYGTHLQLKKIRKVEALETYLHAQGLREVRARVHGELLRLELGQEELRRVCRENYLFDMIAQKARQLEFAHATLDLEGHRSGVFDLASRSRARQEAPHG